MIIFVLLNILCFIIILSKCIWADKASWNRTAHNMISVFTPYHPQLELINLTEEEKVSEEDDAKDDCEHCSRYNLDSDNDNSDSENPLSDSSISTPSIVNTETEILEAEAAEAAEDTKNIEVVNPENYSGGGSSSGSESDDSIVILDNRVNYLKKAQEIVQGLKDELEKKND